MDSKSSGWWSTTWARPHAVFTISCTVRLVSCSLRARRDPRAATQSACGAPAGDRPSFGRPPKAHRRGGRAPRCCSPAPGAVAATSTVARLLRPPGGEPRQGRLAHGRQQGLGAQQQGGGGPDTVRHLLPRQANSSFRGAPGLRTAADAAVAGLPRLQRMAREDSPAWRNTRRYWKCPAQ